MGGGGGGALQHCGNRIVRRARRAFCWVLWVQRAISSGWSEQSPSARRSKGCLTTAASDTARRAARCPVTAGHRPRRRCAAAPPEQNKGRTRPPPTRPGPRRVVHTARGRGGRLPLRTRSEGRAIYSGYYSSYSTQVYCTPVPLGAACCCLLVLLSSKYVDGRTHHSHLFGGRAVFACSCLLANGRARGKEITPALLPATATVTNKITTAGRQHIMIVINCSPLLYCTTGYRRQPARQPVVARRTASGYAATSTGWCTTVQSYFEVRTLRK